MTQHRYDVQRLLRRYGGDPIVFAEKIGVSVRTVNRWIEKGGMPEYEADRVAVACGHHPAEVWDEWQWWSPAYDPPGYEDVGLFSEEELGG